MGGGGGCRGRGEVIIMCLKAAKEGPKVSGTYGGLKRKPNGVHVFET